MAPSPKQISFFLTLTLTLFSSIQARDSQFFNKNPTTTNPSATLPLQDQPDFVPDNENAYGLYGHGSTSDSDQSPRNYLPKNYNPVAYVSEPENFNDNTVSFTQTQKTDSDLPPSKYLPKNYNPVAYVTEPEDFNDNTVSFTETQKTYATNPTNYFNGQNDHDESAYKTNGGYNYYYNGGSSFNSDPERFNRNYFDKGAGADGYQPEGLKDTTLFGARENNFDNGAGTDGYQPEGLTDAKVFANRENYFDAGAGVNGYQPQGMSDTRALARGKYYYDLGSETYSTDHPYERLKGARPTYGEFP